MSVPSDPIERFRDTLSRASASAPFDPTAAALGTSDGAGAVSVRFILLKQVDARGLTFFTNYESRKAHELMATPRAALTFYWPWIAEQVRVEGTVERTTPEESDAYFASRDRMSQLGAWASKQSAPLESRAVLEDAVKDAERRFAGASVPRPPYWGGFRIVPTRIEFWKSSEARLHDRERYDRVGDAWSVTRLSP